MHKIQTSTPIERPISGNQLFLCFPFLFHRRIVCSRRAVVFFCLAADHRHSDGGSAMRAKERYINFSDFGVCHVPPVRSKQIHCYYGYTPEMLGEEVCMETGILRCVFAGSRENVVFSSLGFVT